MPENENPHDESRPGFNQEHYDMLMRCSKARDMTEWNEWREANPSAIPQLEGADLQEAWLAGANLQESYLMAANLQAADLRNARLQGTNLHAANLSKANLHAAKLQKTNLTKANLQKAILYFANFQGADLREADFQAADMTSADLSNAKLLWAKLQATKLLRVSLKGADFSTALMDGAAILKDCSIDRNTYFGGVGLASARIEPGLRAALEGNIRRTEWKRWYEDHKFRQLLVRPFWWVSDYGMNTVRIIGTFFLLAFAFGILYYFFPDLLHQEVSPEPVSQWILPVRALYFSVVTMTTLGFGDIYANPDSILGHLLLMTQVLLGYGLLGALITRLGILFQSLGPAQDYSSKKKE